MWVFGLLCAFNVLASAGSIAFDPVLSMETALSADQNKVSFVVTMKARGWFGVGISLDGTMASSGKGSDIVVCSANSTGGLQVQRYWVDRYGPPSNGSLIDGSECMEIDALSIMKFTRATSPDSAMQRAVNLKGNTTIVWAYNTNTPVLNTSTRHTAQGSATYNFVLPPAPTPAAPTPASPIEGSLQLDSILNLKTSLAASRDRITISLKSTKPGWMGFGVSPDGTMNNSGNGSDVIACSNNTVLRYWVTVKGTPTGGVPVAGATCEQSAQGSTMQFTRNVSATSPTERPIDPAGPTQFIWAYGDTNPIISFHTNKSGVLYDVSKPPAPPTPPTPVAPTPAMPIEGGIQLSDVLSMRTSLAPKLDMLTVTLTSTKGGWMALGVSQNGTNPMIAGGNGSDVIACTNGAVFRYLVTQKAVPTGGVPVPGATCKQSPQGSVMQFTRAVAATNSTERSISVTGDTTFIWAYHDTAVALQYHSNRSTVSYDVHKPPFLPTVAPTPSTPIEGGIQLDPAYKLQSSLAPTLDKITFTLTSNKMGWIGFGVSPDGTMTDSGNGADIIACSNGTVQRYWVTEHSAPVGGVPVPDATCSQLNGKSTMQFTRLVAATSPKERPICVTGNTTFVWAYSDQYVVMDQYHTNKDRLDYDVHNPPILPPTPSEAPTTSAPTNTLAPTANTKAPTAPPTGGGGIPFQDNVMSGNAFLSEDKNTVRFVISASQEVWIGLGVSPAGDMTNGGQGSDIIACSDGVVMRYWVTQRVPPVGGKPVAGATCKQENGVSTMEFTRNIAAGEQQHPIDANGFTKFIWAYGRDSKVFSGAGHKNQGALDYNVADGQSGSVKTNPPGFLWAHMLAMLVAWGALLPFGVTFARYMRKHHDAKLWFTVHRTCQYIGWACQIFGFIMAVVFVSQNGGMHFSGKYLYHEIIGLIVVILGTLQPLNAYFRPHPHPDIDSSRGCDDARTCWEFLHKTCGYTAIALGSFNVFSGAAVAQAKEYVNGFWLIPAVVGGICIGMMILFALQKELFGKGKEDPRPVVGRSELNRKNSEMAGDLKAQLIPE